MKLMTMKRDLKLSVKLKLFNIAFTLFKILSRAYSNKYYSHSYRYANL